MPEPPLIRSGYALPEYVKDIASTHFGMRVLWLKISELRPDNREADVLRALENGLRPLAREGIVRVFRLPNDDYLLAFHRDKIDTIRALLVRLRFLVPDDPLAEYFSESAERDNPLLKWWRLEDDFAALKALSDTLEAEAVRRAEVIARQAGTGAGSTGLTVEAAAQAAAEAHDQAIDTRLARAEATPRDHAAGLSGRAAASGAQRGTGKARPSARNADTDPQSAPPASGRTGLGADFTQTASQPSPATPTPPPGRADGPDTPAATGAGGPDWQPIRASGPAALTAQSQQHTGRRRTRPIDLDILDRLQSGLSRADLSNHVRHQPICALVGDAPPQPVYSEYYVSIPDLRENIAPSINLTANRWLFQHFTETLDQRVLSWLIQEGSRLVRSGFAININIDTILSEHFLRFEKVLAAGVHGTSVLEVRAEDIFSDLEAFAFARDFVHQRGYRLCLDFMTPELLALLNRERMGIDLVKLFWHSSLPARMQSGVGARIAERIRRGENGHIILARCDDPAAIEFGASLGISMYQGRRIDALLASMGDPVKPESWA